MKPTFITDRETWDNALARLPNPQTLQSWDWGAFKGRWGWSPTRLLWADHDRPLAAAQILRRPIPNTPWSMLYVPRGPMVDYDDLFLVRQVLQDIECYGRERKALFIKIDPSVSLAFEPEDETVSPQGQAIKYLLCERGWRYALQQIQFKNTVLLDLTPSEDDLLASMKPKWRYNIRLAGRKGVVVEPGKPDDLNAFYDMYAITARRDGFLIRPRDYYLDVWQQTMQTDRAALLLAKVEGEPVAGLILFFFARSAWYMYGASTGRRHNYMPNHLLQWGAIQTARARGCVCYDMWGAPDVFTESDSMWGVYRFKMGFGARTYQGLGAYDFPLHPLKYNLYNVLLPKALSTLRRLKATSR